MAANPRSGEPAFQNLAYFYVVVEDEFGSDVQRKDDHLFEFAVERRDMLFMDVERLTKRTLGEDFRSKNSQAG